MGNKEYTEFMATVANRYSCRKYLSTPVRREEILKVLESARLAPSACNKQPWQFIVADNKELCSEIATCYDREWAKTAPAFIIACGIHNEAWHRACDGKDHTDVDLSIAIEHICLAATTLGLGTCWVCNFDTDRLQSVLNLPNDMEAIALIPIGYPDNNVTTPEKKRKEIEEIVKWGKF